MTGNAVDKGKLAESPDEPSGGGGVSLQQRLKQAAEGLDDRPSYETEESITDGGLQIVVSTEEEARLLRKCQAFVRKHGPTEGESSAEALGREVERLRTIAADAQDRAGDLNAFLCELGMFPADMDVNAKAGRVQLPPALQISGLFAAAREDDRTWAELWSEATSGLSEARKTAETKTEEADLLFARSVALHAAVREWRMAAVSAVVLPNTKWPFPDPELVPSVQDNVTLYIKSARWIPLGQWIMNQGMALNPRPKTVAGRARAICRIMEAVVEGVQEDVVHPQWVRDRLLKIHADKVAESVDSGGKYKEFFGPKQLEPIETLFKAGKLGKAFRDKGQSSLMTRRRMKANRKAKGRIG